MKAFFLLCNIVFGFNTIVVSQTKKEEIMILNLRIDSLKTVHKMEKDMVNNQIQNLQRELIETKNQLDNVEKKLLESTKVNKQLYAKYEVLFLQKQSDSIKNTTQLSLYISTINSIRDSITKSKQTISYWILKNLNLQTPEINTSFSINKDLSHDLKSELVETDYWLKGAIVKNVNETKNGIELYLTDDDYSKKVIINSDYLIVSYHVTMGDEGNSILIDLKQMNSTYLEGMYVVNFENNGALNIEKDYYDNQGHVWETGIYHINSKRYQFISKEH